MQTNPGEKASEAAVRLLEGREAGKTHPPEPSEEAHLLTPYFRCLASGTVSEHTFLSLSKPARDA
jgi:hypothetical protein